MRRSWQPPLLRRPMEAAGRVRCEPGASCPSPAARSSPCSVRPPGLAPEPAAPPAGHVLRRGPGHLGVEEAHSTQALKLGSFPGRCRRPVPLEEARSLYVPAGWPPAAWPPGPRFRPPRLRYRRRASPPRHLQRGPPLAGPVFGQEPPPSVACPARVSARLQGIAPPGQPSGRSPGSVPSRRGSQARWLDRARRHPCAIRRGRD
jgi:hypothetical protein